MTGLDGLNMTEHNCKYDN